jgi:hypothetical protein
MSETYANNIDNANDLMRNYKQGAYEAASEAATTQLEQYQTKAAEIRDHYKTLATEGGGEIGGVYAVHHLIKRVKAYREGKSKNTKEANNKKEEEARDDDDEGKDEENLDDAGTKPSVEPKFGESTIGEGTAPEDSVFNLIKSDPARFGVADDTPVETSAQRVARRLKELDEPTIKGGGQEGNEDAPTDVGTQGGGGGGAARAGRGVASDATDLGAAGDASDASAFSASSASDGLSGTNTIAQKVVTDFRSAGGGSSTTTSSPDLDINSGSGAGGGGGGAAAEAPIASGAPPTPKVVPKQTPAELEQTEIQNKIQGTDAEDPFMESGLLDTAGAEGAGEAGGIIGSVVADSTVLDAIPLVGEGAAIIQGLVGIGEGIYHLLKGDSDKPPKPPPIVIGRTPAEVSSKFSAALPSADGSVEDMAGQSGTF